MKSLNLNIGIIALIIIVILSNAIYIVNDKQTAILLRFGEIVEPVINPGLHFKVPIYHTVKKFDSRVLTLDALPQPYLLLKRRDLLLMLLLNGALQIMNSFILLHLVDN